MTKLNKLLNKISEIYGDQNLLQQEKKLDSNFNFITDLLPYRVYDEETGLFINQNSIGFILETTPLVSTNEEVINNLTGMVTDGLIDGATLQFLNYASPNVDYYLSKWQQARQGQGKIYEKLAQKRVDFFKNANLKSIFPSSPFTIKDFRLFISVSLPLKKKLSDDVLAKLIDIKTELKNDPKNNIKQFAAKLNPLKVKLKSCLKTIKMESIELLPQDLINLLSGIINLDINSTSKESTKFNYNPLDPINKQIAEKENFLKVTPDSLIFFGDDKKKEMYVRAFSVKNYPTLWAQHECRDLIGDFMEDLRRMEFPFITSFSLTMPVNEAAIRSKATKKTDDATRYSDTPVAKYRPQMKEIANEWQFVSQKLNQGQKILKTFYQVIIFAPKDKIDESEQNLRSIYKSSGFDIVKDKYVNLQSFLAALPFTQSEGLFDDLEKMHRTKTMVSWTCANLAPLQGEWKGMNSPCVMLFGRRGQPLFWNPFDNKEGNFNVAVIGKSGAGKSVFMQELVTSIRGFGGKVYVIDDGRSFMNSCYLQEGEFVHFSDSEHQICINPFSIIDRKSMDNSPEYKSEVINMIKGVVAQMCEPAGLRTEGISAVQIRYIEEAVEHVWEKHQETGTISILSDFLADHNDQRAKDLAILIRPFTKNGIYGKYFEGKANISLTNPLMVFELAEVKNKKELQAIIMMFLMFLVSENMYFGARKTPIALFIDEAWDLLKGEGSKEFIQAFVRRARKYLGSLVTGTQSANDYYISSATIATIENTDWMILLAQKKESIEQLGKTGRVSMDKGLEAALKSVKMVDHQYSEALIYGPSGYAISRLILDPYSIALYSSKAEDFARITQLKQQGYELADALEKISEEKIRLKKSNPN